MKILIFLILLLLLTSCTNQVQTESQTVTTTCPRGDSCAYPGKCPLYQDTNQNKICDHGEIQNE
jgi:hypothetical protein